MAVRLIQGQGIKVIAVKFTSPFCLCDQKGRCHAKEITEKSNIPLEIVTAGADYLEMLRNPKYGYGSGMNPCVDCRVYMLKKARICAQNLGADFIFTGEVLDERPMSQHRRALKIIEKESGLEGKILRPLSAKLLPETEAEKKGWVERSKLMDIRGRSRRRQIELAKQLKLTDYPCPAGGCLLTYKEFARKMKDLLEHKNTIGANDLLLLRFGRHFRLGESKMIVGRDEIENTKLRALGGRDDYLFEVSGYGSPLTLLQGPKTAEAIETAAALTARYSDSTEPKVRVKYGLGDLRDWIIVSPLNEDLIHRLRI